MLFDAIPSELNKNSSRYQVSSVLTNRRAEQTLEMLADLKDSTTVIMSYHVNGPNVGMLSSKDLTRFKIFASDTCCLLHWRSKIKISPKA